MKASSRAASSSQLRQSLLSSPQLLTASGAHHLVCISCMPPSPCLCAMSSPRPTRRQDQTACRSLRCTSWSSLLAGEWSYIVSIQSLSGPDDGHSCQKATFAGAYIDHRHLMTTHYYRHRPLPREFHVSISDLISSVMAGSWYGRTS